MSISVSATRVSGALPSVSDTARAERGMGCVPRLSLAWGRRARCACWFARARRDLCKSVTRKARHPSACRRMVDVDADRVKVQEKLKVGMGLERKVESKGLGLGSRSGIILASPVTTVSGDSLCGERVPCSSASSSAGASPRGNARALHAHEPEKARAIEGYADVDRCGNGDAALLAALTEEVETESGSESDATEAEGLEVDALLRAYAEDDESDLGIEFSDDDKCKVGRFGDDENDSRDVNATLRGFAEDEDEDVSDFGLVDFVVTDDHCNVGGLSDEDDTQDVNAILQGFAEDGDEAVGGLDLSGFAEDGDEVDLGAFGEADSDDGLDELFDDDGEVDGFGAVQFAEMPDEGFMHGAPLLPVEARVSHDVSMFDVDANMVLEWRRDGDDHNSRLLRCREAGGDTLDIRDLVSQFLPRIS